MTDNTSFLTRLRQLLRRRSAAADLPPEAAIRVPEAYRDLDQHLRPAAAPAAVDVIFLRQALLNNLTPDDLAAVAAAVGLDWTGYDGGKGRKVGALLADCEQQGQVTALLAACRARQPQVAWQPAGD